MNEFQGLSVLYLDTTPLEVCVCVQEFASTVGKCPAGNKTMYCVGCLS